MRSHFRIGQLFDGLGTPARKDILLSTEDGMITAIRPYRVGAVSSGESVTDLSTCTVLPPLVDCHVHLAMSGRAEPRLRAWQTGAEYQQLRPHMAARLRRHFHHGILAVRDGGDPRGFTLRFRDQLESGREKRVLIRAAGYGWHKENRYGRIIGKALKPRKLPNTIIFLGNDPADHYKIINSGLNSLSIFARETKPQFTLEELKQISHQAHQQGRKVMVHANGRLPVALALAAGCDSIEHGFFMGQENLKKMAESQTTWVPTACTMQALLENTNPNSGGIDHEVIRDNIEHQLEQLALAREYGVPIALGTDSGSLGVRHGASMIEEWGLLLRAGYAPEEIIQCATGNGISLLNIKEFGRLVPGNPAHFLLCRGSKEFQPHQLASLEGIYLSDTALEQDNGSVISRQGAQNSLLSLPILHSTHYGL